MQQFLRMHELRMKS